MVGALSFNPFQKTITYFEGGNTILGTGAAYLNDKGVLGAYIGLDGNEYIRNHNGATLLDGFTQYDASRLTSELKRTIKTPQSLGDGLAVDRWDYDPQYTDAGGHKVALDSFTLNALAMLGAIKTGPVFYLYESSKNSHGVTEFKKTGEATAKQIAGGQDMYAILDPKNSSKTLTLCMGSELSDSTRHETGALGQGINVLGHETTTKTIYMGEDAPPEIEVRLGTEIQFGADKANKFDLKDLGITDRFEFTGGYADSNKKTVVYVNAKTFVLEARSTIDTRKDTYIESFNFYRLNDSTVFQLQPVGNNESLWFKYWVDGNNLQHIQGFFNPNSDDKITLYQALQGQRPTEADAARIQAKNGLGFGELRDLTLVAGGNIDKVYTTQGGTKFFLSQEGQLIAKFLGNMTLGDGQHFSREFSYQIGEGKQSSNLTLVEAFFKKAVSTVVSAGSVAMPGIRYDAEVNTLSYLKDSNGKVRWSTVGGTLREGAYAQVIGGSEYLVVSGAFEYGKAVEAYNLSSGLFNRSDEIKVARIRLGDTSRDTIKIIDKNGIVGNGTTNDAYYYAMENPTQLLRIVVMQGYEDVIGPDLVVTKNQGFVVVDINGSGAMVTLGLAGGSDFRKINFSTTTGEVTNTYAKLGDKSYSSRLDYNASGELVGMLSSITSKGTNTVEKYFSVDRSGLVNLTAGYATSTASELNRYVSEQSFLWKAAFTVAATAAAFTPLGLYLAVTAIAGVSLFVTYKYVVGGTTLDAKDFAMVFAAIGMIGIVGKLTGGRVGTAPALGAEAVAVTATRISASQVLRAMTTSVGKSLGTAVQELKVVLVGGVALRTVGNRAIGILTASIGREAAVEGLTQAAARNIFFATVRTVANRYGWIGLGATVVQIGAYATGTSTPGIDTVLNLVGMLSLAGFASGLSSIMGAGGTIGILKSLLTRGAALKGVQLGAEFPGFSTAIFWKYAAAGVWDAAKASRRTFLNWQVKNPVAAWTLGVSASLFIGGAALSRFEITRAYGNNLMIAGGLVFLIGGGLAATGLGKMTLQQAFNEGMRVLGRSFARNVVQGASLWSGSGKTALSILENGSALQKIGYGAKGLLRSLVIRPAAGAFGFFLGSLETVNSLAGAMKYTYTLGMVSSWAGFALVIGTAIYERETGFSAPQWIKNLSLGLIAAGFAVRSLAGGVLARRIATEKGSEALLRASTRLNSDLGLMASNKAYQSYVGLVAKDFSQAFWQQAAHSIVFFRAFPTVQAMTGIDHAMDFVLGIFGQSPMLTVGGDGKAGASYWAHLKYVWDQNFALNTFGNPTRMLHDIILGKGLQIFGVTYSSGSGILKMWSDSGGGFFKGLLKTLSPGSYDRISGGSLASMPFKGLFNFLDNLILFGAVIAPLQAWNRVLNPRPEGRTAEADFAQQLLQLPMMFLNFMALPAFLASGLIRSDMRQFAEVAEQSGILLVPQASRPIALETASSIARNEFRAKLTEGGYQKEINALLSKKPAQGEPVLTLAEAKQRAETRFIQNRIQELMLGSSEFSSRLAAELAESGVLGKASARLLEAFDKLYVQAVKTAVRFIELGDYNTAFNGLASARDFAKENGLSTDALDKHIESLKKATSPEQFKDLSEAVKNLASMVGVKSKAREFTNQAFNLLERNGPLVDSKNLLVDALGCLPLDHKALISFKATVAEMDKAQAVAAEASAKISTELKAHAETARAEVQSRVANLLMAAGDLENTGLLSQAAERSQSPIKNALDLLKAKAGTQLTDAFTDALFGPIAHQIYSDVLTRELQDLAKNQPLALAFVQFVLERISAAGEVAKPEPGKNSNQPEVVETIGDLIKFQKAVHLSGLNPVLRNLVMGEEFKEVLGRFLVDNFSAGSLAGAILHAVEEAGLGVDLTAGTPFTWKTQLGDLKISESTIEFLKTYYGDRIMTFVDVLGSALGKSSQDVAKLLLLVLARPAEPGSDGKPITFRAVLVLDKLAGTNSPDADLAQVSLKVIQVLLDMPSTAHNVGRLVPAILKSMSAIQLIELDQAPQDSPDSSSYAKLPAQTQKLIFRILVLRGAELNVSKSLEAIRNKEHADVVGSVLVDAKINVDGQDMSIILNGNQFAEFCLIAREVHGTASNVYKELGKRFEKQFTLDMETRADRAAKQPATVIQARNENLILGRIAELMPEFKTLYALKTVEGIIPLQVVSEMAAAMPRLSAADRFVLAAGWLFQTVKFLQERASVQAPNRSELVSVDNSTGKKSLEPQGRKSLMRELNLPKELQNNEALDAIIKQAEILTGDAPGLRAVEELLAKAHLPEFSRLFADAPIRTIADSSNQPSSIDIQKITDWAKTRIDVKSANGRLLLRLIESRMDAVNDIFQKAARDLDFTENSMDKQVVYDVLAGLVFRAFLETGDVSMTVGKEILNTLMSDANKAFKLWDVKRTVTSDISTEEGSKAAKDLYKELFQKYFVNSWENTEKPKFSADIPADRQDFIDQVLLPEMAGIFKFEAILRVILGLSTGGTRSILKVGDKTTLSKDVLTKQLLSFDGLSDAESAFRGVLLASREGGFLPNFVQFQAVAEGNNGKFTNAAVGAGKTWLMFLFDKIFRVNVHIVESAQAADRLFSGRNTEVMNSLGIYFENGEVLLRKIQNGVPEAVDQLFQILRGDFKDKQGRTAVLAISYLGLGHLQTHFRSAGRGKYADFVSAYETSMRNMDEAHRMVDPTYFILGGEATSAKTLLNFNVQLTVNEFLMDRNVMVWFDGTTYSDHKGAAIKDLNDLVMEKKNKTSPDAEAKLNKLLQNHIVVTRSAADFWTLEKAGRNVVLLDETTAQMLNGSEGAQKFFEQNTMLKDLINSAKGLDAENGNSGKPVPLLGSEWQSILRYHAVRDQKIDAIVLNKVQLNKRKPDPKDPTGKTEIDDYQYRPIGSDGLPSKDQVISDTAGLIALSYVLYRAEKYADIVGGKCLGCTEKSKFDIKELQQAIGTIEMTNTLNASSMADLFRVRDGAEFTMGMSGTLASVSVQTLQIAGRRTAVIASEGGEKDAHVPALFKESTVAEALNLGTAATISKTFQAEILMLEGKTDAEKAMAYAKLILGQLIDSARMPDSDMRSVIVGLQTQTMINRVRESLAELIIKRVKAEPSGKAASRLGKDLMDKINALKTGESAGAKLLNEVADLFTITIAGDANSYTESTRFNRNSQEMIVLAAQYALIGVDYQRNNMAYMSFLSDVTGVNFIQNKGRVGRVMSRRDVFKDMVEALRVAYATRDKAQLTGSDADGNLSKANKTIEFLEDALRSDYWNKDYAAKGSAEDIMNKIIGKAVQLSKVKDGGELLRDWFKEAGTKDGLVLPMDVGRHNADIFAFLDADFLKLQFDSFKTSDNAAENTAFKEWRTFFANRMGDATLSSDYTVMARGDRKGYTILDVLDKLHDAKGAFKALTAEEVLLLSFSINSALANDATAKSMINQMVDFQLLLNPIRDAALFAFENNNARELGIIDQFNREMQRNYGQDVEFLRGREYAGGESTIQGMVYSKAHRASTEIKAFLAREGGSLSTVVRRVFEQAQAEAERVENIAQSSQEFNNIMAEIWKKGENGQSTANLENRFAGRFAGNIDMIRSSDGRAEAMVAVMAGFLHEIAPQLRGAERKTGGAAGPTFYSKATAPRSETIASEQRAMAEAEKNNEPINPLFSNMEAAKSGTIQRSNREGYVRLMGTDVRISAFPPVFQQLLTGNQQLTFNVEADAVAISVDFDKEIQSGAAENFSKWLKQIPGITEDKLDEGYASLLKIWNILQQPNIDMTDAEITEIMRDMMDHSPGSGLAQLNAAESRAKQIADVFEKAGGEQERIIDALSAKSLDFNVSANALRKFAKVNQEHLSQLPVLISYKKIMEALLKAAKLEKECPECTAMVSSSNPMALYQVMRRFALDGVSTGGQAATRQMLALSILVNGMDAQKTVKDSDAWKVVIWALKALGVNDDHATRYLTTLMNMNGASGGMANILHKIASRVMTYGILNDRITEGRMKKDFAHRLKVLAGDVLSTVNTVNTLAQTAGHTSLGEILEGVFLATADQNNLKDQKTRAAMEEKLKAALALVEKIRSQEAGKELGETLGFKIGSLEDAQNLVNLGFTAENIAQRVGLLEKQGFLFANARQLSNLLAGVSKSEPLCLILKARVLSHDGERPVLRNLSGFNVLDVAEMQNIKVTGYAGGQLKLTANGDSNVRYDLRVGSSSSEIEVWEGDNRLQCFIVDEKEITALGAFTGNGRPIVIRREDLTVPLKLNTQFVQVVPGENKKSGWLVTLDTVQDSREGGVFQGVYVDGRLSLSGVYSTRDITQLFNHTVFRRHVAGEISKILTVNGEQLILPSARLTLDVNGALAYEVRYVNGVHQVEANGKVPFNSRPELTFKQGLLIKADAINNNPMIQDLQLIARISSAHLADHQLLPLYFNLYSDQRKKLMSVLDAIRSEMEDPKAPRVFSEADFLNEVQKRLAGNEVMIEEIQAVRDQYNALLRKLNKRFAHHRTGKSAGRMLEALRFSALKINGEGLDDPQLAAQLLKLVREDAGLDKNQQNILLKVSPKRLIDALIGSDEDALITNLVNELSHVADKDAEGYTLPKDSALRQKINQLKEMLHAFQENYGDFSKRDARQLDKVMQLIADTTRLLSDISKEVGNQSKASKAVDAFKYLRMKFDDKEKGLAAIEKARAEVELYAEAYKNAATAIRVKLDNSFDDKVNSDIDLFAYARNKVGMEEVQSWVKKSKTWKTGVENASQWMPLAEVILESFRANTNDGHRVKVDNQAQWNRLKMVFAEELAKGDAQLRVADFLADEVKDQALIETAGNTPEKIKEWMTDHGYTSFQVPALSFTAKAARRIGEYYEFLGNNWSNRSGAETPIAEEFKRKRVDVGGKEKGDNLFALTGVVMLDAQWYEQSVQHEYKHALIPRPYIHYRAADAGIIMLEEVYNYFGQLVEGLHDKEQNRRYDMQMMNLKLRNYAAQINFDPEIMIAAFRSFVRAYDIAGAKAAVGLAKFTLHVNDLLWLDEMNDDQIKALLGAKEDSEAFKRVISSVIHQPRITQRIKESVAQKLQANNPGQSSGDAPEDRKKAALINASLRENRDDIELLNRLDPELENQAISKIRSSMYREHNLSDKMTSINEPGEIKKFLNAYADQDQAAITTLIDMLRAAGNAGGNKSQILDAIKKFALEQLGFSEKDGVLSKDGATFEIDPKTNYVYIELNKTGKGQSLLFTAHLDTRREVIYGEDGKLPMVVDAAGNIYAQDSRSALGADNRAGLPGLLLAAKAAAEQHPDSPVRLLLTQEEEDGIGILGADKDKLAVFLADHPIVYAADRQNQTEKTKDAYGRGVKAKHYQVQNSRLVLVQADAVFDEGTMPYSVEYFTPTGMTSEAEVNAFVGHLAANVAASGLQEFVLIDGSSAGSQGGENSYGDFANMAFFNPVTKTWQDHRIENPPFVLNLFTSRWAHERGFESVNVTDYLSMLKVAAATIAGDLKAPALFATAETMAEAWQDLQLEEGKDAQKANLMARRIMAYTLKDSLAASTANPQTISVPDFMKRLFTLRLETMMSAMQSGEADMHELMALLPLLRSSIADVKFVDRPTFDKHFLTLQKAAKAAPSDVTAYFEPLANEPEKVRLVVLDSTGSGSGNVPKFSDGIAGKKTLEDADKRMLTYLWRAMNSAFAEFRSNASVERSELRDPMAADTSVPAAGLKQAGFSADGVARYAKRIALVSKAPDIKEGLLNVCMSAMPVVQKSKFDHLREQGYTVNFGEVKTGNAASTNEATKEIIISRNFVNLFASGDPVQRALVIDTVIAGLRHELSHALGGEEVVAYRETIESLKASDQEAGTARHASVIAELEFLELMAHTLKSGKLSKERQDAIQILEGQIAFRSGLETLMLNVILKIYSVNEPRLNDIPGVIPVDSADQLEKLAGELTAERKRNVSLEHRIVTISSKSPLLTSRGFLLADLASKGVIIMISDKEGKDLGEKIYRVLQLAATLGRSEFEKFLNEHADGNGFFSVTRCMDNSLIKAVLAAIETQKSVDIAA